MKNGYVKLFSDIVASSIWVENDAVRIVWITMLALADRDGMVRGAVPGLANIARVSVGDCQKALQLFMEPDMYSRNKANEGRRIEEVDGGWKILNYGLFREKLSKEDRREYHRRWMREHRSKMKSTRSDVPTNIHI